MTLQVGDILRYDDGDWKITKYVDNRIYIVHLITGKRDWDIASFNKRDIKLNKAYIFKQELEKIMNEI